MQRPAIADGARCGNSNEVPDTTQASSLDRELANVITSYSVDCNTHGGSGPLIVMIDDFAWN